jgi:hydroxypyruvate reductase
MTLPPDPGYGGRNQHLALSAAVVLRGQVSATLLAAGTDGIDGVTADAGAIIDGDTWQHGGDAGLDASQCLVRADSGRFLEATGDLLHTGPTLTNVGDVVFALRGRRTE